MSKVKIGFEIDGVWERAEFRELIRLILIDPIAVSAVSGVVPNADGKADTFFELYIISTAPSAYINSVVATINLWFPVTPIFDSTNTIVCSFSQDKVNACISNNIDIYFDADNQTDVQVDIQTTSTYPVLVRTEADRFNARQKYITDFLNILKNVISEKEDGSEC